MGGGDAPRLCSRRQQATQIFASNKSNSNSDDGHDGDKTFDHSCLARLCSGNV